ncbi:putative acetyltransferase [alpha proteobacterium BAL199]|jgi:GNAT superfamily N-acetyltransferase|nr:putative acetyltransferase [alpha proteobacterium BAL199]
MSDHRHLPLEPTLSVLDDPSPSDLAELDSAIYAYNTRRTGIHDGRRLAIVLRDDDAIYAGLHGYTWGRCCEIKTLWVSESRRGRGLGTKLLLAAEREALRRDCTQIVLSSHSFQAPEFYEKRGYRRLATIQDYPAGHSSVVLVKTLSG